MNSLSGQQMAAALIYHKKTAEKTYTCTSFWDVL